ncbi:MAG: crotonase/enoyl-CoA hydratase family protein [Acidimicrobiaceae bacterium]|nr:crotonase/enoyl-CoA hydratase family protein [Acidimicrobiaceae bacterium]
MTVRLEVANHVAVLTIDRPEVRNAIDLPTAQAIADTLDEIDARPDVRAAVLTSSGPVFSAGMDLKAFNATGQRPLLEGRGAFGICERATEKPLVAAVEGKALGGGFEIALACDLIVASTDASFGLPEVKRGLVAAAGGVLRIARVLPQKVALELALTGEPMSALEACRLGLVNRLAEPGQALEGAIELAGLIAGNAPLAVRTSKQLVLASSDWVRDEAFERQAPYTDKVRGSSDAAEGVRAFVEKRPPAWTGS